MKLIIIIIFIVHQIFARPSDLDGEAFAACMNGFSDDFMRKLEHKEKNLIYSPFGLSMALGMLLKAAKGKTYDDIYKMLNMGELSNKDNIHYIFKLVSKYKGKNKLIET
ncbi:hypothetical protein B4U80_12108 [Leptotrombidium deliense]|uniref:Serpin domain-containing protein n=1 Tax=Leptotrombidium deliense TaxID=299467 RepID=A0A443RY90_9ACAR|nr:hypothetical protein B4U80_12108 [Leptotrombidium deliense]